MEDRFANYADQYKTPNGGKKQTLFFGVYKKFQISVDFSSLAKNIKTS